MTAPDMWGGKRVWTINFATADLAPVLLAPTGRTQFRLDSICEGDTIIGYDVVPINLPSAWTQAPCRFFPFGSIETPWPTFDPCPPGPPVPLRPLQPYDQDKDGHFQVASAIQQQYPPRPTINRLLGQIHVGPQKIAEAVTLYKVEDAIVDCVAFLSIIVNADPEMGGGLRQSGIAMGNN
jgi:hypothetical protein